MLHEEATLKSLRPIRWNTRRGGFLVVHPKYRAWLRSCGIRHADDAMALKGEIVGGHPDRHVVQVELSGRTVFVKRELIVGIRSRLKNWADGAGLVSRSEREADTLRQLESAGLSAPQWLAYGRDTHGRAFLMTAAFEGECLPHASVPEPTGLAERIGVYLAELHEAGFGTPELSAKHLLVNEKTLELTLLDWASCRIGPKPTNAERAKWLGTLQATLPRFTERHGLRLLWAYRRVVKANRKGRTDHEPLPRFSAQVRAIRFAADYLGKRSSVKFQIPPHPPKPSVSTTSPSGGEVNSQRLVWLDGEAVVAVPEIASEWPVPASVAPFYRPGESASSEWVTFAGGQRGIVQRFTTLAPWGRLWAALRERPWRSPAARCARILFHLARHGIPAPALYAFGQRASTRTSTDSFVALERIEDATSWNDFFLDPVRTTWERRQSLEHCGALLRLLHEAGCMWADTNEPIFQVIAGDPGKVLVASPVAIDLCKKPSRTRLQADLQRFRRGLERTEAGWFLRGYLGGEWAVRRGRRARMAGVL